MEKRYKASFDHWLLLEAALIRKIRALLRDASSTLKAQGKDYDTVDVIIDVLAATIISKLAKW